jgi:hypothetical protein
MLFLNIYTWEPGQRDALIKRRMEKGIGLREGVKKVGEWSDLSGGRGFLLVEAIDAKACMSSAMAWSDLMKMEIVPLIETTALFKEPEKGKKPKK